MIDLPDIVGQTQAVSRLAAVIGGNRRPHAFLFVGPDGVGRQTTAAALAKTLLCENPVISPNNGRLAGLAADAPLTLACNKCTDCKMMDSGSHPDFNLIYKELAAYHEDPQVRNRVMQELGIEVIRRFLIQPIGQRPARGKGKIFVILEADLMSVAAQNSMLKTLEEPPPGVTIILIAQQSEQLLPTTLSRCSLVRFGLLPHDFVTRQLLAQNIPQQEAEFWAKFTDGSIGRAAKLSHQGMYEIKCDLIQQIANMNRAGDAELGEKLAKTTEKLAEDVVKATRTETTEMSKNLAVRMTAGEMFELIASAYRDAMTVATAANRPITNSDQMQAVKMLADKFDAVELAAVIEQLSELEELLWRNVNPKTIWDNVVITCASAARLG